MKAAVCTAYGPPEVLQIRTVPDPHPRDKEVCIRLYATAVTASDCIVRGLKLRGVYRLFLRAAFGIRAPRRGIIGMIAAGEIESVGRDVTPSSQVTRCSEWTASAPVHTPRRCAGRVRRSHFDLPTSHTRNQPRCPTGA